MTLKPHHYRRIADVAFGLNAALPAEYQAQVYEAGLQAFRETVVGRGLDERTVLIAGGAGYIGSVLTEHLLARGYRVRSLDLLLFRNGFTVLPYLGHPGYSFMHGDMADAAVVEKALDGVTDVVVLAGLVGDPITKKYPAESAAINDRAILDLFERCKGRGLGRVVFVSTCSNYGLIPEAATADENYELKPLSLYAKSKVAAETALLDLQGKVDFTPVILRFATAFGLSPRMRFDLTVSEFTRAMHRGDDLLVYDADTWRPYCHVRDFGEVIRRAIEAPAELVGFEVFNAGGNVNNFTKQMIVDAIKTVLPEAPVRYQTHGADPRNYRVSFEKIGRVLHFTPTMTVMDGIRELVGALDQKLFDDIERDRNIYGNYEIAYD